MARARNVSPSGIDPRSQIISFWEPTFRFAENRALIRLFAIWEVSGYTYSYPDRLGDRQTKKFMPWDKEAFSAVIFPQFSYFFSNGFEAELGGLVALGRDYTRFGDPAVGGSLVWSRFRVRY